MMASGNRRDLRARKRFGQHFLEPAWVRKVLDAIAPRADDTVVEIGPGRGELTLPLAGRVRLLTVIEIDRDLAADLARRVPGNVRVMIGNVLATDFDALVSSDEAGAPDLTVRIIGNLPYNISSPILIKLLDLQRRTRRVRDVTVMLQREVADRLAAAAGSREYGVLSVLAAAQAEVTRLLTLPPGAFRPAPNVSSAVVRLAFRAEPVVNGPTADVFERLVRSVFTARRKTLLNALKRFAVDTPLSAGEALAEAGIAPGRRPETLEVTDAARLADVFVSALSRAVL